MSLDQASKDTRGGGLRAELLEWVKLFAVILAVGLIARAFIFQAVRVDGPSMNDTLHHGEIMFVGKLAYRVGDPERGDVAICRFPGEKDDYVKRVVGIPGDTLEIVEGGVYINGERLDEPYVKYPLSESLGAPIALGADEYFMLGDNRANSEDSRALGVMPRSGVKGRVNAVIWPLNQLRRIAAED